MLIFLVGFMGSGKSYTGQRLAARLGFRFVDLDAHIEARAGADIPALFAAGGEAAFRAAEREALRDMAGQEGTVVATGGGAPCFFDNMAWMNEQGITIFLDAPEELLLERLRGEQAQRPLLRGKSASELADLVREMLGQRRPWYEQAAIVYRQVAVEEDVAGRLLGQFSPQ